MSAPKKLLIITSWETNCGIAAFAETVKSVLDPVFDIEIGVLDQFILKGRDKALVQAGDRLIAELVERAKQFDAVNFQWEPGLLGSTKTTITRRFRRIVANIPGLLVTVHTVVPNARKSMLDIWRMARRNGLINTVRDLANDRHDRKTVNLLLAASRKNNLQLIVHTKRELRYFREALGVQGVHDHPLSLIRKEWSRTLAADAARMRKSLVRDFGKKVFIGFSGFLGGVKGVDVAVQALRYLPDNYTLLIFGGVHPSAINAGEAISPVVKQIMDRVHPAPPAVANARTEILPSLTDRVKFMGIPTDYQFAVNIAACDVNVFPYVEVGQSASGPAAQSIELGKRTVTTNNRMFLEIEKYFRDRITMFDVGNYIQLAQTIEKIVKLPEPGGNGLQYDKNTMAKFYAAICEETAGYRGRSPSGA